MTQGAETLPFRSEARQLLDLMIHSLYSHKEIFLRELVSNASDALDKLRIEALRDKALVPEGHAYEIRVEADRDPRRLRVVDTGVGMSRDDLVEQLGTIARSGTREYLAQLRQGAQGEAGAELIGQFGVGFYSSFMAASEVTVVSRRAGSDEAWRWSSRGEGEFTIEPAERDSCGTTVELVLRDADDEDGLADFTDRTVLEGTIRRYSDFVTWPIRLRDPKKEATHDDAWPVVNSRKPIWQRPESEVQAEEYAEFYRHLSRDWKPPLEHIRWRAEGTFEYAALVFLPEQRPFDLFHRDAQWGLQLYVRRVMILERAEELLPPWLRFVRGVVESPDLALNVSREILQHDRRVARIRAGVTAKVLERLEKLRDDQREEYERFWRHFGSVLKEGILSDEEQRERLTGLLLFESTADPKRLATLKEYVERMPEGQEAIWYATGEERAMVERAPHLEALRARGHEVLFWVDPIDEFVAAHLPEFDGKKLRAVARGELGKDDAEPEEKAKAEKEHAGVLAAVKAALGDLVDEVRLSSRLVKSPACLVGSEHALSPHLRKMLEEAGQTMPEDRPALELNPDHPVFARLEALKGDDAQVGEYSKLLYGLACLAEGRPVPDPVEFADLVTRRMVS